MRLDCVVKLLVGGSWRWRNLSSLTGIWHDGCSYREQSSVVSDGIGMQVEVVATEDRTKSCLFDCQFVKV